MERFPRKISRIEPLNLVGTARCAVRAAFSGATMPPAASRAGTSQRDVPTKVRFMESPLSFFACIGTMNHPLTRPPGTLSPSEGERDGVRGRFMEREKLDGELCSWIWGAHIQFKPPNTRNTPKQKPWRAG